MLEDHHRHAPVGTLAKGIIQILKEEGLTEKNEERIHFILLASYEQGLRDGQELAKVLSGKPVYARRRPPADQDPVSAYDS